MAVQQQLRDAGEARAADMKWFLEQQKAAQAVQKAEIDRIILALGSKNWSERSVSNSCGGGGGGPGQVLPGQVIPPTNQVLQESSRCEPEKVSKVRQDFRPHKTLEGSPGSGLKKDRMFSNSGMCRSSKCFTKVSQRGAWCNRCFTRAQGVAKKKRDDRCMATAVVQVHGFSHVSQVCARAEAAWWSCCMVSA